MGNIIKINCKKVYEEGLFYIEKKDELETIKKELEGISSSIESAWSGLDNHNFKVSLKKHIEELNPIIDFFYDNGELLKKIALEHGGIDYNFAKQMERSEEDE